MRTFALCSENELYEVVSRIFWEQALTRDVGALHDEIAQSNGFTLITTAVDSGSDALCEFLSRLAPNATMDVGDPLFVALARIAEREVMREGNFEGVIYVDELVSGAAPHSQRFAGSGIGRSAVTLMVARGKLKRGGRLCLRSPLPAVVQCGKKPPDVFLVDDTQIAMAHQRVMLMDTRAFTVLPDGSYLARGVLHVFLNPGESSDSWRKWLPNAMFTPSGGKVSLISARDGDVLEVRSVIM